jgi:hypothetical protein
MPVDEAPTQHTIFDAVEYPSRERVRYVRAYTCRHVRAFEPQHYLLGGNVLEAGNTGVIELYKRTQWGDGYSKRGGVGVISTEPSRDIQLRELLVS